MPVLRAETAVYGGYTISRADGVVFFRGAIPGEVVEVSVSQRKRDYCIAEVTDIVEPSSERVVPRCPYFGDCGGCQLQFASYEKQISMKSEVLKDCLKRIGGIEIGLEPPLTGPEFNYRRRAQFKISKDGAIGFYREGTREVVAISNCPLMSNEINETLGKLSPSDVRGLRELHVTHGEALLALVKGSGFDEAVAGRFMEMGFSGVAFDDGTHAGDGYASLNLLGLVYTVSPWSFFQSNWELNKELTSVIAESLRPLDGTRVVDLYAGAGNFSLPLSREGAEVLAVEENQHAIKDGQRNVAFNKIKRFKFMNARAEEAKLKRGFQVALLDPPRPGLTGGAMKAVLEAAPERVAYISCNPSTFARDLNKLSGMYTLESVRMVDLFPNTYHIESLAFLRRSDTDETEGPETPL